MIKIDGKEYRNLEEEVEYLEKHSSDYDSKIQELTTRVNSKCDKVYVDNKVPDIETAGKVLTSSSSGNIWTDKTVVKGNESADATEELKNLKIDNKKYLIPQGAHSLTFTDEIPTGTESTEIKYLAVDDTEYYNFQGGGSAPTNMVTTDTNQEITGDKTFTKTIISKNDTTMLKDSDTGCMQIGGGSGTLNGANLLMFGDNWSDEDDKGAFYLYTTKGDGSRTALRGRKDDTLTWDGNDIITADGKGTSGQLLQSQGAGQPGKWVNVGGVVQKYQHNICASDSGSTMVNFSFINDVATPYTTNADVSQAIYNLGFNAARTSLAAAGTVYSLVYGTTSGNFYYWKNNENKWSNGGWNALNDIVIEL